MTRTLPDVLALAFFALVFPSLSLAQKSSLSLEEVIVTAQKRAQSLQNVPIAITAVSQEMMENQNIFDVLDLQKPLLLERQMSPDV